MKGLCISLICLHNLTHLVYRIKECEFAFYPKRVEQIFSLQSVEPWDVFALFFSFWGWYGVPIFMFFSGYGLVMKHERKGVPIHFKHYFARNYVKLMLLMIIPWALCFQTLFKPRAILQLTYTINIFMPDGIIPGVFWYFGLTLQFYVLYVFFYRHRDVKWLLGVSAAMLALDFLFTMFAKTYLHLCFRHNSPFWLPVFLMGVWFARGGCDSRFMLLMERHRAVFIIVWLLLWAISSVVRVLWVFSPLFFVLLMLSIFHDRRSDVVEEERSAARPSRAGMVGKALAWMGAISSGIFVCHPVVRMYAESAIKGGGDRVLVTVIYFAGAVLAAALYTPLYKKALPVVLRWLKLDKVT